jgi:hypothetical protein
MTDMKKFKKLKLYTFYTLLISIFLISCKRIDTVDNFCGGIIYKKEKNRFNELLFTIKKEKRFKRVYVFEIEYNLYKVGDTIKCK